MQKTMAPPFAARTGVWVGIAAITMSFAAYSSAMVIRQGPVPEWQHFKLPPVLYLNTFLLVMSSVTLELARRRVGGPFDSLGRLDLSQADAMRRRLVWMYATLGLGLLFLGGQYLAWTQLSAQGVFLSTSASSSFFYVLTAVHALHLLGGLGALTYALRSLRADDGPRPVNVLGAAALYWHFMAVLWVYLFVILALWV